MDAGNAGDAAAPLEAWAGLECTINRVGDRWLDQLSHLHPGWNDNLAPQLAELGVKALRYPVLWEAVAPEGLATADWSRADADLAALRDHGIEAIVGLVHHGSGPRHTHLLDPRFADGLAEFAAAVAARYPWVRRYTPVNEPLTTARFSGLYGLWYPHARSPRAFREALFNQVRGTVLAMRAIRAVQPDACLVQTDDLGLTHATPRLQYQARFNNRLRWLGWDLLTGRVTRRHALWKWLQRQGGASVADIAWFERNPCAPDIVGVNYYVTSERFLDERLDRYPPDTHGGNHRQAYADVEAARVLDPPGEGLAGLLRQAWERYRLPLAITEVHLHAGREDELRWFREQVAAADAARAAGADVRAVTAWALYGSHDWSSLLTQERGHYETGVFDARGDRLRPTALAQQLRAFAHGEPYDHPVLAGEGWWRRPLRLFGAAPADVGAGPVIGTDGARPADAPRAPLLVTGATGTLGQAFARICSARDIPVRVLTREELDIADPEAVARALDHIRPWGLVNAAGYVRVDDAERDAERCFRENAVGPAVLAAACARSGVRLMTFSSDLVFDGRQDAPYVESDAPAPLNVYGRSKAEAEARVLSADPDALVVRTSAFFGPWDRHNFVSLALRRLGRGDEFVAAHDCLVTPTYVPDLVHGCLDLLVDGECGLWHLSNGEALSWAELADRAAGTAGIFAHRLRRARGEALGLAATRPRNCALGSERSVRLPTLDDALRRFLVDRNAA